MIWPRKNRSQITISVEGIRCNHCESTVRLALVKISGVQRVKIRQRKQVIIEFDPAELIDRSVLNATIENAGYTIIASEDI